MTIDLSSEVDTHLYLREGIANFGVFLHENDGIATDDTNSRIVAVLEAGAYTIEATTHDEDAAGSFTLSVGAEPETTVAEGCTPASLTLPETGVSGFWGGDCQSSVSGRGYARFYTFTLAEDGEVTIDLTSGVDTYLYLRNGSATSGTSLHDNDDIETGNANSQIVADLEAGSYTIEATTRDEGFTGSFTLTVSSAQTTAAAATFPSEPLSVAVERGGTGELDVSWEEPGSNGGSAITGYKVQWKEAANSWDTLSDVSEATTTNTTYTITSLSLGVEYSVRVIATNSAGDGPASSEVKETADAQTSQQQAATQNNPATGLPTISGRLEVERTLSAETSGMRRHLE